MAKTFMSQLSPHHPTKMQKNLHVDNVNMQIFLSSYASFSFSYCFCCFLLFHDELERV